MLMPLYYIGCSFGYGLALGKQYATAGKEMPESLMNNSYDLAFNPDLQLYVEPLDTVASMTGEKYPILIHRATVLMPKTSDDKVVDIVSVTCSIISLILFVGVLVAFIMFVVNINKGRIFEKRNASLLRYLGGFLIAISIFSIADGIFSDIMFQRKNLSVVGYSPSIYWLLPWGNLLMGLLSLLMGQVWARGISLKKEQELTI